MFVVIVGLGVLAYDFDSELRQIKRDQHEITGHADDFLTGAAVDYAMKSDQVDKILFAARIATDEAAIFAIEQRRQLHKTSVDSDKSVKALRLVIDRAGLLFKHTDEELGEALPQITQAVVLNAGKIGNSADALTIAADGLNVRIADPRLDAMLDSYNAAARNLSAMTAKGDSVLGHADHVAAYYDKKLTTPAGFVKTMVGTMLDLGSKAGNIATGFFH